MGPSMRTRFAAPFDPRGRLSARDYRRILVRAVLVAAGLLCLAIWLAAAGFRTGAILAFAANLGVALHLLAATAQRLHDRNRSGLWLVAYAAVYGASFAPLEKAADEYPLAVIAALLMILGFLAWFFVETMLRPGRPGPNRFGPTP